MTFSFSLRSIAVLVTALLVGLALLPDFVFFPLVGGAAIIAGTLAWKSSVGWGVGLVLSGIALAAFGVKCILDRAKSTQEEAEKTAGEVQRRTGRVYTPGDDHH